MSTSSTVESSSTLNAPWNANAISVTMWVRMHVVPTSGGITLFEHAPLTTADGGVDIDDDARRTLPFTVKGVGSVRGGTVDIDASASSQFVSALLLSGPRLLVYGNDLAALVPRLHAIAPERAYIVRPANLEDVFLKLSGRELRD